MCRHRNASVAAVALLLILGPAGWVRADTLVMTNGTILRGKITSETQSVIIIDMQGAVMTVPLEKVHSVTTRDGRREVNPLRRRVASRKDARSRRRGATRPRAPGPEKKEPARPAYETETWPETRLLVWARPGKDGEFREAANWIEKGRPASRGPDRDTDVLLPAADRYYKVKARRCRVRHVTVERNGLFIGGHRSEAEVWGNLWVKDGGRAYYISMRGLKHTFFRMDNAEFPGPGNKAKYGHSNSGASSPANRTQISHKFQVCKYGDASVEFIGKFGVSDEIMVQHGKMILSGDLRWSGVTAKGALEIYDGGILELQSGATAGPMQSRNRKCVFNIDVYRNGVIQAGSPERPLTSNAYLMLGFAANDRPGRTGLYAARGSQIRVYSTDPKKYRLVFTSITSRPDFCDGKGRKIGDPQKSAHGNTGITMQLAGDVQLDGAVFDYVCKSGIKLADFAAAKKWTNVSFGPHNAGAPGQLLAAMTMDPNVYYHNRGDMHSEFALTTTAVKSMTEYMKRADKYKISASPKTTEVRDVRGLKKPMPIVFTRPVQVTLKCEAPGARMYYTLDGSEPTEESKKYGGPFTLSGTCRLRVKAFKEGVEPSHTFSTAFVFK